MLSAEGQKAEHRLIDQLEPGHTNALRQAVMGRLKCPGVRSVCRG